MNDNTTEQSLAVTAQPVSGFFRPFPVLADSLTDQQRIAIRSLLLGNAQTVVAQQIGVTPRTIYNWLHDRAFRRALEKQRYELWSQALDRLRSLVHPSLTELEKQLRDRNDKSRYRSANAVLRHANLRKCAPVEPKPDDCEDDPTA